MTLVNHSTGEIVETAALVPVNTGSEVAITSYLSQARDWLSRAVDETGPEQIAAVKAEIATAAEATKQLGLSKEIREDAAEMVRRAEYALRKATLKAQQAGEMRTRESSLVPGARTRGPASPTTSDLPRPRDLFGSKDEYEDANVMARLDEAEFDEVIAEARAEGNLSRANVARKAREASGAPKPAESGSTERNHQEAELINAFASIVRRSLTKKNVATLSPGARRRLVSILTNAIDTLEGTDHE